MQKIFDGMVYPAEQVVPKDPEYWAAYKKTGELMMELEKKLEPEDYGKVEEMVSTDAIAQDHMNKAMFECGFSMGLLLIKEASTSPYIPKGNYAECVARENMVLKPEKTEPAKEEKNK